MIDMQAVMDTATSLVVTYVPKLALAIITLLIGLWVISGMVGMSVKVMKKKNIDLSLRHFLESLIGIALKVMLVIAVIGMVGVETTSFVAVLAAAGFAIGMALQGSLGNFAGGVLILIFKPYQVGDFIEAQGESGTVSKIEIFNTVLKTPDNKTVIVPNGAMANGNITNYSTEDTRRVDFTFAIGYGDDIKKAEKALTKIASGHKLALKEKGKEPFVRVKELGDSSVNFAVRIWVKQEDYWTVFFDVTEQVKATFDKEKISIPYPQMDVHVNK
ncbi:mechanosensitive ion channel [Candidatus Woesearchaeota archaeon]|nr:mechanosensitive ion channel [Candidatus Woesearchaeota archaeon]